MEESHSRLAMVLAEAAVAAAQRTEREVAIARKLLNSAVMRAETARLRAEAAMSHASRVAVKEGR